VEFLAGARRNDLSGLFDSGVPFAANKFMFNPFNAKAQRTQRKIKMRNVNGLNFCRISSL
jgi:hypothetical protein